jgi:hypothetical protein
VESPYAIATVRLLILTGCRKNEILTLKRSFIDPENLCLRLPDSKTGTKVVHIGAAALRVVQALPEVAGNPYLLPGYKGDGHVVDLQQSWQRIRDAAGLSDVRLHDLRHAFASLGARGGDSLLVIGSLLGHRSAKTTHRYTHLADHPLKDAADRISADAARLMALQAEAPAAEPQRRAQVVTAPPGTQGVLGSVIAAKWIDTLTAAALLDSTVGTLQTWRWLGVGPPFRKVGDGWSTLKATWRRGRRSTPRPRPPVGYPGSKPPSRGLKYGYINVTFNGADRGISRRPRRQSLCRLVRRP